MTGVASSAASKPGADFRERFWMTPPDQPRTFHENIVSSNIFYETSFNFVPHIHSWSDEKNNYIILLNTILYGRSCTLDSSRVTRRQNSKDYSESAAAKRKPSPDNHEKLLPFVFFSE